jgi:hypothetical protein
LWNLVWGRIFHWRGRRFGRRDRVARAANRAFCGCGDRFFGRFHKVGYGLRRLFNGLLRCRGDRFFGRFGRWSGFLVIAICLVGSGFYSGGNLDIWIDGSQLFLGHITHDFTGSHGNLL